MSDFYTILRKSILDRGIAESSERTAIYAQARRAMIRRLWSFDPPLDGDEVERRIAAFDVAVSDIEADVTAAFSDADDPPDEAEDDYAERPAEASRYEADDPEADYHEADYREAGYREAGYREATTASRATARRVPRAGHRDAGHREAEYRERDYDRAASRAADGRDPEYGARDDYPVARRTRLPALADPAAFGRQVREAGLVRYYEEARRVEAEQQQSRYDRDYETPYEEPEYDEPPPVPSRALARRQPQPEPLADPYADEPGYGEPPPRRPRPSDRWSTENDEPREPREPKPRKTASTSAQRRLGLDDDGPQRRQRQRQKRPRRPLSDRDKIFMLLGAIGVCVLVLGGIGVYVLMPRDGGVTVDIDARHEVSDAATAVRLAAQAMPIDQTFMLFDGRDPTVFETSPDNPIHFDASAGSVRISSSTGSPGVKVLVGPGLATRLAGHQVRVTIVARSSTDTGAASMRFAYQSGVAISHWQTANLGADFQAVALTWRVPTQQTDRNGDILLIQPGVPGDGTGADIKSIRIDLLAAQP